MLTRKMSFAKRHSRIQKHEPCIEHILQSSRTKVPTWLAAYRNSNCVHSQSETFVHTGILAVCLAPASAAAPCSVCVQRLLQWLLRLGETVTFENMYIFNNCVHSQSDSFAYRGILAVCLAPASAAAPCSVSVSRLMQ